MNVLTSMSKIVKNLVDPGIRTVNLWATQPQWNPINVICKPLTAVHVSARQDFFREKGQQGVQSYCDIFPQ